MEKFKEYKINSRNSTVCGYPGRGFDWSKFCWDGTAIHRTKCFEPNCEHEHRRVAPLPFKDDGLIEPNNEYLHVPFNWEDDMTIFRVRPNESMRAGQFYRGHLILATKAVLKEDGWYWQLEIENGNQDLSDLI